MIFFNSKLWLPVWIGSKGQIGVNFFVNIFLTINDLYNSAKIVNLPLAVVEIWFFYFRFGQEVKVKLGHFFINILVKERSVQWCKNCEFTSCGCWDMIFLNIKLWFIVIRYLMTHHDVTNFVSSKCSKYMPSFKFVWSLQVCVFL